MAKKPPVHVFPRGEGWAVVREGNDRATSVHPTQAQAASVGRDIARKDGTSFLLHAKDGRVRDRSDYGKDPSRPREKPASPVAEAVSGATRATGDTIGRASGDSGEAVDRLGLATLGATRNATISGEGSDDKEEVRDLAYEERSDRFTAIEDRFTGYTVYDQGGEQIGKVDDLFLDEDNQPEYIGVKMGFLGTRSTLIPMEVAQVYESDSRIEVSMDKDNVKDGPALDDDREITPEYEDEVRSYYDLDSVSGKEERVAYGAYYGDEPSETPETGAVGSGVPIGDTESDDFREHGPSEGSDLEDEDDIRVQRTEEDLRVDTRKREAGSMRIRKRVRTDRERTEVPVKREEVHVERVPVVGEATEAEIGEDEIVVPVIEEEVVVSKRPVVKEEVRIRKDVVEDTEIVEEDVRREEIDVEDETTRRDT